MTLLLARSSVEDKKRRPCQEHYPTRRGCWTLFASVDGEMDRASTMLASGCSEPYMGKDLYGRSFWKSQIEGAVFVQLKVALILSLTDEVSAY